MIDTAKAVETDGKNTWFLTELLDGKSSNWKTDFDMTNDSDKTKALESCTPFSTVIGKIGSLFANCKVYLVDKDGNDINDNAVSALLKNPNPIQTFRSFICQVEMCIRTYGYCPIYTNRLAKKSVPKSLWIIQPSLFHIHGTGKSFKQVDLGGIIKEAYIQTGAGRMNLSEEDYFIIYDAGINIPSNEGGKIGFKTAVDALSIPVSNWMASMVASNTLIVNGGPKGIIYNDDSSEAGNAQLTSSEQKSLLSKFKEKYGLMKKQFSVLITKAKLGWIPLNYDSSQLKLHEEDKRCTVMIANAVGINPSLFNESKYENQEAAKRSAYQDLIIPNAEIIADALTSNICQDGQFIKIDFSHVECLQADKVKESLVISTIIDSLTKASDTDLITNKEARILLSKYIDIDPNKPQK